MANGLIITEQEFVKLPTREQRLLLYQNQVKTMELIKGYKLYNKLVSIIGTVLAAGVGILFKLQLTGV